jgi:hypothetical protein
LSAMQPGTARAPHVDKPCGVIGNGCDRTALESSPIADR